MIVQHGLCRTSSGPKLLLSSRTELYKFPDGESPANVDGDLVGCH